MNIRSKAPTAPLAQPPQPILHSISVSPSHPTCHQPPLPNDQQTTKKEASRSRNHDRKGFYLLWQERRVRMRYVRPNTNYSTPSCRDSYPRLHLRPPIDAHVGLAQHLHLLAYLLGLILRATSPPTTFPLSSTFCSPPQTNPSYNIHCPNTIADRPPPGTAKQATCSCGKQSALHCTCAKSTTENKVDGARCSCRARPAGQCTCDRASTENQKPADPCACGVRPAGTCLPLSSDLLGSS